MIKFSPLNIRRLQNFKSNKRGLYSLWIFLFLFVISIFASFISNDKPLLISYKSDFYFPIIQAYSETTFGGDFETEADYKDPYVKKLINDHGWYIMPLIPSNILSFISSSQCHSQSRDTVCSLCII